MTIAYTPGSYIPTEKTTNLPQHFPTNSGGRWVYSWEAERCYDLLTLNATCSSWLLARTEPFKFQSYTNHICSSTSTCQSVIQSFTSFTSLFDTLGATHRMKPFPKQLNLNR